MKIHTALRKDHRCSLCGRRIPLTHRYWASADGVRREHTNCVEYEKEDVLPEGYNHNRPNEA